MAGIIRINILCKVCQNPCIQPLTFISVFHYLLLCPGSCLSGVEKDTRLIISCNQSLTFQSVLYCYNFHCLVCRNRTNIWLPTSYVQIRSEPHVFQINKLCYVHLNPCNQPRTFISAIKSNFPYLGSGLVPGVVRIRTKLYILQINKLCNVQLNPCNQSLTYISAFKSNSL